MSHLRRPTVTGVERVHVTLKLQPGLPSLRTPALKACVEQAIDAGHERFGMKLLAHTLDKDGLSLLVIAPHRRALSRGIQGISVRIARAVNRKLERKGRLFADRYDAQLASDPAAKSAASKRGVGKAGASKAGASKAGARKAGARKAGGSGSARARAPGRKASARKASARKVSARKVSAREVSAREASARRQAPRRGVAGGQRRLA